MPKLIVILVVYYPEYFSKAVLELKRMFRNKNMEIIIVDNKGFSLNQEHLVTGSNLFGEFSGWDEGYSYACSNIAIDYNNDMFIFANDTFCNHRYFTFIDRLLYKKALNKLKCEPSFIFGELNTIKENFSINNMSMDNWLSSYFFCIHSKNVDKILPFCRSKFINSNEILCDVSSELVEVSFFSNNLNRHLSNWLFPKGNSGWYGAAKHPEKLQFKLIAIVNEKLLSYQIINNKLKLKNVYEGRLFRIYNSIRNKLFKIIN